MAGFCTNCGKPLKDGEKCSCQGPSITINKESVSGFLEKVKNRMGVGDPELNKGDAYENGKQIVPECIKTNEGEVPVKQYSIATLKNCFFGIPYAKAKGRIQVTNKRVVFRAPGRCIAGRTTLQHEFTVDEIAGLEARREYVFSLGYLLLGAYIMAAGGGFTAFFLGMITRMNPIAMGILSIIFGGIGGACFFLLHKKWPLKLLLLGGSDMAFFTGAMAINNFYGKVLIWLGIISTLITIACMIYYAIRPNLVLVVKTKSASEGISIKRKKSSILNLFGTKEENSGYKEVYPVDDAEKCIREINAMITDIQKLGDFGIEKWKA